MKRVYKYVLKIEDKQTIDLPVGFQILSVQNQKGLICLWALVPIDFVKTEPITLMMYGTGHDIVYDNLSFIDTVQTHEGSLVWHIFELLPK